MHGDLTAYDVLLTAILMFRKTLTILSLMDLPHRVGIWEVQELRSWENYLSPLPDNTTTSKR